MVTLNSKAEENLFLNSSHYIVTLTNDALWLKLYNTYFLTNTTVLKDIYIAALKTVFDLVLPACPTNSVYRGFRKA